MIKLGEVVIGPPARLEQPVKEPSCRDQNGGPIPLMTGEFGPDDGIRVEIR